MAKKAKPARPRPTSSGGGDSNTGMIVTLVFFVLASLTLGVFTYFGYDGQTKLVEEAKAAKAKETAAMKDRDEEKTRRLTYAVALGTAGQPEQDALDKLKAQQKNAFDEALKSLKEVRWVETQNRPAETILVMVNRLRGEAAAAKEGQRVAEQNLAAAQKAFDDDRKALTAERDKARGDLTEANTKAVTDLQGVKTDYLAKINSIDKDLSQELASQKTGRADDQAAAEREQKRLAGVISGQKEQISIRDAKIAPPNSLEADTPKGQVLRVERGSGTVYINLGSADYIKPQVTFSVLPPNTSGKTAANRDPKAAVEVVNVIEPHLSMARILNSANATRDPILTGDLLFNPSWNPGQREHVALAGIFDLDGDGKDDTAEVVRTLERQGIVVDAWLNIRDRSIHGPGITERTTYLVLGERPQIAQSLAIQAGQQGDNPVFQAFTQVTGKIAEMEKAAKDKGVQPVAYRRYLTLVGYPLPKLSRPVDASSVSYIRPPVASHTAPPPPEGEPANKPKEDKPKDEKKNDKPKDEK